MKTPKGNPAPCLHCALRSGTYARGLCYRCKADPEVRARYPSLRPGPRSRRGVAPPSRAREPSDPTDARPGTEEKIRVLEARALRGEYLFHPGDAR